MPWLTIKEAATKANFCPRYVQRLVARGIIPSVKQPPPGHKRRIRSEDIDAWLARREAEAADAWADELMARTHPDAAD